MRSQELGHQQPWYWLSFPGILQFYFQWMLNNIPPQDSEPISISRFFPCVARTSATMALIMQRKWVLVILEEGFQLPVPSVRNILSLYFYVSWNLFSTRFNSFPPVFNHISEWYIWELPAKPSLHEKHIATPAQIEMNNVFTISSSLNIDSCSFAQRNVLYWQW